MYLTIPLGSDANTAKAPNEVPPDVYAMVPAKNLAKHTNLILEQPHAIVENLNLLEHQAYHEI